MKHNIPGVGIYDYHNHQNYISCQSDNRRDSYLHYSSIITNTDTGKGPFSLLTPKNAVFLINIKVVYNHLKIEILLFVPITEPFLTDETCVHALGCPYLQKFGPLILPKRYVIPMYEKEADFQHFFAYILGLGAYFSKPIFALKP